MLAHCSATMDMVSGRLNPPRILIGRLIGPAFRIDLHQPETFWQERPGRQETDYFRPARVRPASRQALNGGCVNSTRQRMLDVRGIRIPSSESLRCRIGAAACTNSSTTTSDSSARERRQQNCSLLTERWQLNQIVLRDRLEMSSGFAPSRQPPDDHERVESLFPQ